MIDCLKCYRLRRHNDTVYCPFLDLKECVRGEHYINIASLPFKPQKEETPPLPPKMVKAIPPFKPHPNSPHDWEKFHNQIFEMKNNGVSSYKIAAAVGLPQTSVFNYMKRYDQPWTILNNQRNTLHLKQIKNAHIEIMATERGRKWNLKNCTTIKKQTTNIY